MDAGATLLFVVLGGLLGAAGQGIRAAVGVKKDAKAAAATSVPKAEWFDTKELVLGLIVGAVAGMIAAISQVGPDTTISKSLLFGFVAAGYSGADFINGVMKAWLPNSR